MQTANKCTYTNKSTGTICKIYEYSVLSYEYTLCSYLYYYNVLLKTDNSVRGLVCTLCVLQYEYTVLVYIHKISLNVRRPADAREGEPSAELMLHSRRILETTSTRPRSASTHLAT